MTFFSQRPHIFNQSHVNFRFSASRNAVNQGRTPVPPVIAATEILCNLPLLSIKKNFGLLDLYIPWSGLPACFWLLPFALQEALFLKPGS